MTTKSHEVARSGAGHKHGGARSGAGRKPGSGRFGEPTTVIRIPASRKSEVLQFIKGDPPVNLPQPGPVFLPVAMTKRAPPVARYVQAGFPSPAEDYTEKLDIAGYLDFGKPSVFGVYAKGDSMTGADIHDGDLLIVDRALEVAHGDIVIAFIENRFTVKRFYRRNGKIKLQAANQNYPDIEFREGEELVIWGIVTGSVRRYRR